MRALHNPYLRHSGLDPESRKYLIILDSRFHGNDKIVGFMWLCKGLTNILAYALDLSAGGSHAKSFVIIESLWEAKTGAISTQVPQEFYVTVTRKIKNPLKLAEV